MSVQWVVMARGRKEDRGHTVIASGESDDPWRRRAYLKCQCGSIFSAIESPRAYRTHKAHQEREWAILDSEPSALPGAFPEA